MPSERRSVEVSQACSLFFADVYFVIAQFLSNGPCKKTFEVSLSQFWEYCFINLWWVRVWRLIFRVISDVESGVGRKRGKWTFVVNSWDVCWDWLPKNVLLQTFWIWLIFFPIFKLDFSKIKFLYLPTYFRLTFIIIILQLIPKRTDWDGNERVQSYDDYVSIDCIDCNPWN